MDKGNAVAHSSGVCSILRESLPLSRAHPLGLPVPAGSPTLTTEPTVGQHDRYDRWSTSPINRSKEPAIWHACVVVQSVATKWMFYSQWKMQYLRMPLHYNEYCLHFHQRFVHFIWLIFIQWMYMMFIFFCKYFFFIVAMMVNQTACI